MLSPQATIVAKIHRKRQTWFPVQGDAKRGAARLDGASRLRFLGSLREIVTAVLRGMEQLTRRSELSALLLHFVLQRTMHYALKRFRSSVEAPPGAFMNHVQTLRESDVEKLGRIAFFSWLTSAEIQSLGASLAMSNWGRGETIFREPAYASFARVLVTGIGRITCLNADNERVTVGLVAPGPIPELPSTLTSRFDFRCEAYSNCRVGTLDWKGFGAVASNGQEVAFTRFHHSSVKYWYRLFRRTSDLLNINLHERIALTMLDLSEDFGIADARGTLLGVPISHKELASIVGATRPRVTEHLNKMARERTIIRQRRQFIINTEELSRSLIAR